MKIIKINIPQIVFENIEFTVPDGDVEDIQNLCANEKAKLAMKHMTEQQVNWLPDGQKGLANAFEYGYTKIKIS